MYGVKMTRMRLQALANLPELLLMFGFGHSAKIQAALDKAAAVWARQEAHEILCTERWGQVRKVLDDLHGSIKSSADEAARTAERAISSVRSLWWLILICAGALITGMAGLIVTLVLRSSAHGG